MDSTSIGPNQPDPMSNSKISSISRLDFQVEYLKMLVADLLSLLMPTIAFVTGHAAAAGFLLAISHDYILMRKDRGVLYMSELDIELTLPEYVAVAFREKMLSSGTRRVVLLGAKKLRAEEALAMRIVDPAHGSAEETVEAAVHLAEELAGQKWNGEIYEET